MALDNIYAASLRVSDFSEDGAKIAAAVDDAQDLGYVAILANAIEHDDWIHGKRSDIRAKFWPHTTDAWVRGERFHAIEHTLDIGRRVPNFRLLPENLGHF